MLLQSVNQVVVLGAVSKHGVEVLYLPSGTAKATLSLVVHETRQGKEFTTYIPCEIYGKGAEAAGELEAGEYVLCQGKLGSRKKGEGWELVVQGFECKPMLVKTETT